MHLLNRKHTNKISMQKFIGKAILEYAVISYSWGNSADEITLGDLMDSDSKQKAELAKIHFCTRQAVNDGLKYFRMNTC
jgi:hypothetical protein